MRTFRVGFICVMLCGLAGCSSAPKIDSALVTSSPLPGMQTYNRYIGYDYWLQANTSRCGIEFLMLGTHVKVDGLVPNYSEVEGKSVDGPYFHVALDNGRSGFMDARYWSIMTTTVDPVAAAAECKKKGDPKLGMNSKQVTATCWGPPAYVNTKIRATGKYEQYVYGDNKFVYLRDGIVTSVSVKGRAFRPVH
jgi:hypothetical protein